MKNVFSQEKLHTVTEANINFYANPFVHPKRIMKDHDFIYLLSGKWKFGQNKKVYDLRKDHILILAANHKHFGLSPCEAGTKTMYFHASCNQGDYSAENVSEGTDFINSLIDVSSNRNIKKLFSYIVNSKLSGEQRKADLGLELLLSELSHLHTYSPDSSVAERIKNIIHQNPERFFANRELAERINVSVKTAENKFKSEFGTTIHQYILKFKTEEAISYFNSYPQMSIKEISANLGFYDEYHFSKSFKKLKGISPRAYRRTKK